MKEICVRTKEEVAILDISEICEDSLYYNFINQPTNAIYVQENSIAVGMITLGDFRRNQLEGKPLVTTNFTKVGLSNEAETDQWVFADN